MIVGLAGHIDHGKTSLVRALTGVDTDRLPEEKKRGITIELGFAPLALPGLGVLGVIDVPGHEGLVRTMLAGATGIDIGLLVVAADEGPMPQTIEHLSILSLLGVPRLVVALTKCDIVDQEWLALAMDDVRQMLAGTPFADAPCIPTAAPTGLGLDQLRQSLADALSQVGPERANRQNELFRMPIDRVFTVKGTGLVVTGTVWSGNADASSALRVFPGAHPVRVRSIRTFGTVAAAAAAGHRTALALAGVQASDLLRGCWLVGEGAWSDSTMVHAEVNLRTDSPLGPREWVRLHLGTADLGARVVFADRESREEPRTARIVLDAPLLSQSGDRFVLRRTSPVETIGGGVITDPAPLRRRSKPRFGATATPTARLASLVAEAGPRGVQFDTIPIRLGLPPAAALEVLGETPSVVRIGTSVLSSSTLDEAAERVVHDVDSYLNAKHFERGAPRAFVAASLSLAPEVLDHVLSRMVQEGRLAVSDGLLARPGWKPVVTEADAVLRANLLALLSTAEMEPPDVTEIRERLGTDPIPVLKLLEREDLIVQVESGRYYLREVVDRALARMKQQMEKGREYGPADLRGILGSTRKYLIPFLEYCDRRRITERHPGGRVLRTE